MKHTPLTSRQIYRKLFKAPFETAKALHSDHYNLYDVRDHITDDERRVDFIVYCMFGLPIHLFSSLIAGVAVAPAVPFLEISKHIKNKKDKKSDPVINNSRLFQPSVSTIKSPILTAIHNDDLETFKGLIQSIRQSSQKSERAVLNSLTSPEGCTLLHYSCVFGALNIVEHLLCGGNIDINALYNGQTALEIASKYKKQDIVDLFPTKKNAYMKK